jgi:hypothetical protein
MTTRVTLQYFDGCPHWRLADQRIRELARELDITIEHRKIETAEEAERLGFRGSPTVLVDGVDPFAKGDEPVGLTCRLYETPTGPHGSPTTDRLRAALT